MKRNTESKYRQKIINECNLNKQQQKELDIIIKNHGCKYKWVYSAMPNYDNKKLYVKKLFEIYPKNRVKFSKFNNYFILFKAALQAISSPKEDEFKCLIYVMDLCM